MATTKVPAEATDSEKSFCGWVARVGHGFTLPDTPLASCYAGGLELWSLVTETGSSLCLGQKWRQVPRLGKTTAKTSAMMRA